MANTPTEHHRWVQYATAVKWLVYREQKEGEAAPVEEEEQEEPEVQTNLKRAQIAAKIAYNIATSHIGLILLLLAYSFIGAIVFVVIEGSSERTEKGDLKAVRVAAIQDFATLPCANNPNYTQQLTEKLDKFEAELRKAFEAGIHDGDPKRVWDLWGSFMFCATVYTTVGYGHISPATPAGQWATVIYAIFGIPLCLIVLTDLGGVFARGLKYIWKRLRRRWRKRKWFRKKSKQADKVEDAGKSSPQPDAATGDAEKGENKMAESGETEKKPDRWMGLMGALSKRPETNTEDNTQQGNEEKKKKPDGDETEDEEDQLPFIVPIFLTFLYMLMGVIMYTQWETWTFTEAFYFIFISISTIGFGDVLPDHPKYFMSTSGYLLFGLALLAMCVSVLIDVMSKTAEVAREKVIEAGEKKLGVHLVSDSDSDDERTSLKLTKDTTTKSHQH